MLLQFERPIVIYKGDDNNYHFNGGVIPTIEQLKLVKELIDSSILMGQREIDLNNEEIYNYWKNEQRDVVVDKKPTSRRYNGYIYIYKQDNNYKIGKSKREDCRIRKYITENPYEIELFFKAYVCDYDKAEQELHNIFKESRINENREWFIFDQKDLSYIKNLKHSNWGKEFIKDLIINRFE